MEGKLHLKIIEVFPDFQYQHTMKFIWGEKYRRVSNVSLQSRVMRVVPEGWPDALAGFVIVLNINLLTISSLISCAASVIVSLTQFSLTCL